MMITRCSITVAVSSLLLSPTLATAGNSKDVAVVKDSPDMEIAPVQPAFLSDIGGEVSAGYDSDYVFRGANVTDNLGWGQVKGTATLWDQLDLELGAWYAFSGESNGINGSSTELDLFGSLSYDFGWFSLSAGYTWYHYDGSPGIDANEPFVGVSTSAYGFDYGFTAYFDDFTDGFYFENSLSYSVELSERWTMTPSVILSFTEGYYGTDGFYHVEPKVSFDYALTDWATLSSYLAWAQPLEDLDDTEGDSLYGGVSMSFSF